MTLILTLQFSRKMERAQEHFSTVSLAHDIDTARDLLQQHQDMKKSTTSSFGFGFGLKQTPSATTIYEFRLFT